MNLNMIRPKIETEDLILSITKNCESWLAKHIENLKKHSNSNCSNR